MNPDKERFQSIRVRGGITLRWMGKGKPLRPVSPPPKPADVARPKV